MNLVVIWPVYRLSSIGMYRLHSLISSRWPDTGKKDKPCLEIDLFLEVLEDRHAVLPVTACTVLHVSFWSAVTNVIFCLEHLLEEMRGKSEKTFDPILTVFIWEKLKDRTLSGKSLHLVNNKGKILYSLCVNPTLKNKKKLFPDRCCNHFSAALFFK